ncbi:hypothetical protein SAMCFNEI73_Ch1718 [Sinorhizobium americanum]|uniref:Uncharacterized protein n=1 Tax=Sinorhizobium americanum TaxID=194963 RepID=A0A1L3LLQ4_9HYPH|nr:hypothetical protein SAMCCGM7_Ch1708 [Sinorhizobium americanum CCGM7]APG91011.1 hypothetical protein SAMCFNEI73_Ch1718 [Sinorhizobium americanum]
METSAIDKFGTPALGWWFSYPHVYGDTNHLSAIILPHRVVGYNPGPAQFFG